MMTNRLRIALCGVVLAAAAAIAAENTFTSTWKSPDAGPLNYFGRKVAALVIVDGDSLRVSAEEALAREMSARGSRAVPAYRLIPREELKDKDRAKAWFEKAAIEGMVVIRVVGVETEKVYSSYVWSSGYYANGWDYYGNGWATVTPIGKGRNAHTITVETLLYDMATAKPLWGGVSHATDPRDPGSFMKALTKDVVKELQKAGLVKRE